MKLFAAFLFYILIQPSLSYALAAFDIKISDQGYRLEMDFGYKNISLSEIKNSYKNGVVLSHLSPNIKSIELINKKNEDYDLLMTVKSFGLTSKLLTHCQEKQDEESWQRSCLLDTNLYDGGDFMIEKADMVVCKKGFNQEVDCKFAITGKAKAIELLGFTIVSSKKFTVKAKMQAMNNFFKYYYFIKENSLSFERAENNFNNSLAKVAIEKFASTNTDRDLIDEHYALNE
jgi:hypothetical protein